LESTIYLYVGGSLAVCKLSWKEQQPVVTWNILREPCQPGTFNSRKYDVLHVCRCILILYMLLSIAELNEAHQT